MVMHETLAGTEQLDALVAAAYATPLPHAGSSSALWGCQRTTRSSTISSFRHCPLDGVGHQVSKDMLALAYTDGWLYHHFFCDACTGFQEERRAYVELGALDGRLASNTNFFEKQLGFRGVLIEGLPANAHHLYKNRGQSGRNVIFAEAVCNHTGTVRYMGRAGSGSSGIVRSTTNSSSALPNHVHGYDVPCRPLGTMVRRANFTSIDLVSLDVEGAELIVLQSFDWSIPVRVFVVELDGREPGKDDAVRRLLASKGYGLYKPVTLEGGFRAPQNFSADELVRGKARIGYKARQNGNEVFLHRALLGDVARRRDECGRCERLPLVNNRNPGGPRYGADPRGMAW